MSLETASLDALGYGRPPRRTRYGKRPMRAFDWRTPYGRRVRDCATRLLALLDEAKRNDPFIVNAVLNIAELRLRTDQALADPMTTTRDLTRLEHLIDRRMRALGLVTDARFRNGNRERLVP